MKKLQFLKTASIISFLLITYSGGSLTLNVLLWLIVGVVASIFDLLCFSCDHHLETLKNLFIISSVIISVFLIFSKKKKLFILGIIIQYLFLSLHFEVKFLKHWYFSIPTLIYSALSLVTLYCILFKKEYAMK
jgi:hypothetical protein